MSAVANIVKILVRVVVDDIDAALPLYVALADGAQPVRFDVRDVSLAEVGPFLLLSGATAAYLDRAATVVVRSLDPVLAALAASGGALVEGPAPGPTGRRVLARHPDGAVVEYIERPAS